MKRILSIRLVIMLLTCACMPAFAAKIWWAETQCVIDADNAVIPAVNAGESSLNDTLKISAKPIDKTLLPGKIYWFYLMGSPSGSHIRIGADGPFCAQRWRDMTCSDVLSDSFFVCKDSASLVEADIPVTYPNMANTISGNTMFGPKLFPNGAMFQSVQITSLSQDPVHIRISYTKSLPENHIGAFTARDAAQEYVMGFSYKDSSKFFFATHKHCTKAQLEELRQKYFETSNDFKPVQVYNRTSDCCSSNSDTLKALKSAPFQPTQNLIVSTGSYFRNNVSFKYAFRVHCKKENGLWFVVNAEKDTTISIGDMNAFVREDFSHRGVAKPIIYLYPATTTNLSVHLNLHAGHLTYTYPTYDSTTGWQVKANPSGELVDKITGRHLYSLFWEGTGNIHPDDSTGFCVAGDSTEIFLDKALDSLGLNYREKQEFIIYWVPKLKQNSYNYIHFARSSYAEAISLSVSPPPQTINRFLMLFRPLKTRIAINPQKLTNPGRKGFTVVEWGGSDLSDSSDSIK